MFLELTQDEAFCIDGGGWDEVFNVIVGSVLIGCAVPVGLLVGVVGTPVGGVAAGGGMVVAGVHMLYEAVD